MPISARAEKEAEGRREIKKSRSTTHCGSFICSYPVSSRTATNYTLLLKECFCLFGSQLELKARSIDWPIGT
jgi:hypothetical protein